MLNTNRGKIKLPNGKTMINWQYYEYLAYKTQLDYINKLKKN